MEDTTKFKEYMALMGEYFEKEISKPIYDLYWSSIKRYSDKQCVDAFQRSMSELKWFPKINELIDMINGGAENIEDKAMIEAGRVLDALKRVGGYQSVKFDDQTTHAVIEHGFGGWAKLCQDQMVADEKWFLKDFAKMYCAYKRQGVTGPKQLAGLCEIENHATGRIDPGAKAVELITDGGMKQIGG